jgi:arylsulfatase A-like enzyme
MSNKKNILLILTDQHRLSALACYGDTPCKTPNLDRLAAESVMFKNTYTTCPLCSPARASIMTGLYPHNHGVTSNTGNLGCNVNNLPDSPHLLSRKLEKAGYGCGYTGKWHLGTHPAREYLFGYLNPSNSRGATPPFDVSEPTNSLPKDVGFRGQNFHGHGGGGYMYKEYKQYLQKKGFKHEVAKPDMSLPMPCGILNGPTESTVDYFLVDHTIQLIEQFQQEGKPFFIWHNFWGPHSPYYVTQQHYDMYKNVSIPRWPNYDWPSDTIPGAHRIKVHPQKNKLIWEQWEECIRYYYAYVTMIDEQIGRLLDDLERKGLLDDTVIVFAADHGETIGSHGGLTDKGYCHFEEIQKIPLLIRLPEQSGHPQVKEELASLADIYPTILELAGAEYDPNSIDGMSLSKVMEGNSDHWRNYVAVEFNGLGNGMINLRTLIKGDYKYGFTLAMDDMLFNLHDDPHEMNNLAGNHAYGEVLLDMQRALLKWMEDTCDPMIPFLSHQMRMTDYS